MDLRERDASAEAQREGLEERSGCFLGGDEHRDREVAGVGSRPRERVRVRDARDAIVGEQGGGELGDALVRGGAVAVLHRDLLALLRVRVERLVRGEADDVRHLRQAQRLRQLDGRVSDVDVPEVDDAAHVLGRLREGRRHLGARRASVGSERDDPRLPAILNHEVLPVAVVQVDHGGVRVERPRGVRRGDAQEKRRDEPRTSHLDEAGVSSRRGRLWKAIAPKRRFAPRHSAQ